MDGEDDFDAQEEAPSRCPEDCPNAAAPYCPRHEDPAIYRRDETKLHLAEAYANNAAREIVFRAIDRLREKRRLKEVRVPTRVMDEWIVFTKQVALDSGEHTAEGEIERKVGLWIDKSRAQDWERLDRIKERYMRFTSDARGETPPPKPQAAAAPEAVEPAKRRADRLKRPAKPRAAFSEADAQYFEDES